MQKEEVKKNNQISNHVIETILAAVQGEMAKTNPLTHRVAREVVLAHRGAVAGWINKLLDEWIKTHYQIRRQRLENYMSHVIRRVIHSTAELRRLERLPFVGQWIAMELEKTITVMTVHVVDQVVADLRSQSGAELIEETSNFILTAIADPDGEMSQLLKRMFIESLTIVTDEIAVKKHSPC